MKNSENADMPISAIVYTPSPFRLSGKAAQASLRPLRSRSRISTPTLNQKTDSANIKKIANHSGHLELLTQMCASASAQRGEGQKTLRHGFRRRIENVAESR